MARVRARQLHRRDLVRPRHEPGFGHALRHQTMATFESIEPEAWERTALEWTALRLERVRSAVRAIFVGVGIFWISLGLLIASLYFPAARLLLLFATAGVAVLFGAWFVALGLRFNRGMNRRIDHVNEMAEMSNVERHAHVARRIRKRGRRSRRMGY